MKVAFYANEFSSLRDLLVYAVEVVDKEILELEEELRRIKEQQAPKHWWDQFVGNDFDVEVLELIFSLDCRKDRRKVMRNTMRGLGLSIGMNAGSIVLGDEEVRVLSIYEPVGGFKK